MQDVTLLLARLSVDTAGSFQHSAQSFLVGCDRGLVSTDLVLVVLEVLLKLLPQTFLDASQTLGVRRLLGNKLVP